MSVKPPILNNLTLALQLLIQNMQRISVEVRTLRRGRMLRITRAANGEVVFKLSGRMDAENVGELEKLFGAEASGRRIVLDLEDLTLVDQDVVSLFRRCEANGIELKNCPAYIREWISGERDTDKEN
jgi:hypothetical protein